MWSDTWIVSKYAAIIGVCWYVAKVLVYEEIYLSLCDRPGYQRVRQERQRRKLLFLPYLIVGGICMIFLPPLGLLVWLIGSIAVSFSRPSTRD
jgi:hypothetical protein